mgnify:CR=1 FL=1
MGFRKRNARQDNKSKSAVIMGKPASELTKEEKKILSARMAEIRSENGSNSTVQNTIPFLCMYKDGVCQVSENFYSLTVQFYDWYDGMGGTKRDTEVTIANAVLINDYERGDSIKEGKEFAKTTAGNVNFHIYIDTDGYGWDYIDPRLVLY